MFRVSHMGTNRHAFHNLLPTETTSDCKFKGRGTYNKVLFRNHKQKVKAYVEAVQDEKLTRFLLMTSLGIESQTSRSLVKQLYHWAESSKRGKSTKCTRI
jgi:hypothetical protein